MAPIAVGDTIPDGVLSYLDEDNTSQKFHVHEELKGKKVVLLAVPGAFTPTCRYLSLSLEVIWEG
jgi:peroxiredoxin